LRSETLCNNSNYTRAAASGERTSLVGKSRLSVRPQVLELQEFAVEHNCRLVPTGDTKQHHSVQWGDALRILERSGFIAQAELTKTYRQQIPQLRGAIEDLSKSRIEEGFDKLDKFGAIQEIPEDADRVAAIAERQIEALRGPEISFVIAPTHGEFRAIAGAVRKAMKEKGVLSDSEHSVTRLQRLNLTDAQRRDAVTYESGQFVEFHRMAKGAVRRGKRFKSGELWEGRHREAIATRSDSEIQRARAREDPAGNRRPDPVHEKRQTPRGRKFLNNELQSVVSIDDGKIIFDKGELVRNGAALHLDQGIVVTSHASQSKTVDQVIASVPVRSFSQANEAQFYVTVSRASLAMHVFTDVR
jgi:hypothetical protein